MTEGQPDNLVLQMLRDMRERMATKDDIAEIRSEITETRSEVTDMRSEMNSLRADVASDILTTRKELSEQIVGLRRAVIEYHSSVIGHGNIIAELEARLRRVEQRLGLENH